MLKRTKRWRKIERGMYRCRVLPGKNTSKNLRRIAFLFWHEIKRAATGKRFTAEFDITDRCNLRCSHCYHLHLKADKKKDAPLEVWRRRFKKLHKSGIRVVQLMGGEPTLRMDVIELATKTFPVVYLTTNGLIKIPENWDIKISLSVDGMDEANDSIRGKGVFARALKNYSGDGRVLVNMVLTKDNYRELEDVVLLAKKNNFSGVVCNICSTASDADIPPRIEGKERQLIIEELKRVRKRHPKALLVNRKMIEWFEFPDHRDYCHWRSQALHYNVNWTRRPCYSDRIDCGHCGCMAGAMQSPLRMICHPMDLFRIASVKDRHGRF